jgi:glc operon protein GlcG
MCRPLMSVPNLKKEEATMTRQCISTSFASIALLVLMPLPALTQTPFAPPPQIPYGLSVSTESAKNVAAAAIAEAQKNNWKMAIAIVDTGGYLVYFEKMQDTQTGSVELAIEKARTAALFRRPTKVFQDGVAAGGEGLRLLRLTGAIPIDGGVPIIVDGKVLGAVGVSGGSGEQDGQVAKAGAAGASVAK